jgi:hypothetical protein
MPVFSDYDLWKLATPPEYEWEDGEEDAEREEREERDEEMEAWARDECERRGLDPDEICADGGVEAWMVVAKERQR